jgi:hypothetical protein
MLVHRKPNVERGPRIAKAATMKSTTSKSRPSGEWSDDDYDVFAGSKPVPWSSPPRLTRVFSCGGVGAPSDPLRTGRSLFDVEHSAGRPDEISLIYLGKLCCEIEVCLISV